MNNKHKNCNRNFLSFLKERININSKEGIMANKELCLINKEQAHAKEAIMS
tara:strand:+ start:1926 stop:2078 length:153 start_codon:yes stop_codon:yes gene_type:complete